MDVEAWADPSIAGGLAAFVFYLVSTCAFVVAANVEVDASLGDMKPKPAAAKKEKVEEACVVGEHTE